MEDMVEYNLVENDSKCRIIPFGFSNQLPAGIQVVIIEIEGRVTYEDGTSESFGPRRVNIPPQGKDEVFMTSCTFKCATKIYGKMTIHDTQGGRDVKVARDKTMLPDAGKPCLGGAIFPLGKS